MKLTRTALAATTVSVVALAGGGAYAVANLGQTASSVVLTDSQTGTSVPDSYGGTAGTVCTLTDVKVTKTSGTFYVTGSASVVVTGGDKVKSDTAKVTAVRLANGNSKNQSFGTGPTGGNNPVPAPFSIEFNGGGAFRVSLAYPGSSLYEPCSVTWTPDVSAS